MRCTSFFFSFLTCPVFFFFSKLPDPRIISNCQKYHYQPWKNLIFPVIFCSCDCKLKLFSNYFGNHFGPHGNWPQGEWDSSVSTQPSQICVMNTGSAQAERRDLCWQNNLTHCSSQQVCWWQHLHLRPMILRKKICCKSTNNEWKGSHNKIVWLKFVCYWCRILDNSWSRTVLHDKGHWRVLTIYRFSGLSWVHFANRWKLIWPERLDSRENPNWARVRSHNQLPAR